MRAGMPERRSRALRRLHGQSSPYIALLALLILIPLQDIRPVSAQAEYDQAWRLFQRGYLKASQQEAGLGYRRFRNSKPRWAARFQLLEAQSMLFRGMYPDALEVLGSYRSDSGNSEENIRKLVIEAVALTRQDHLPEAQDRVARGQEACSREDYPTCGDVLGAAGILADKQGQLSNARELFLKSFYFAQTHHDRWSEAAAALNLGFAAMRVNHYDEAVDWSRTAYRDAVAQGALDTAQVALGNLGWAYYQLGDGERALDQFLEAEKSAVSLGDDSYELNWTSTAGYVYRDSGDLTRATQSYRQALSLAKKIDSKEDIVNALEDLAQVSVDSGKLDEASAYIGQVTPMELAGGGHLSANVLLAQGMLAAARRQDQQAESLFRAVKSDPNIPTTTRLGAGEQLARLFELQGKSQAAEQMYRATLNEFDSAQAELKSEESKLPFVTNAAHIYDDYIHLLVQEGRSDEALAAADRSRARTLAQGLGLAGSRSSQSPPALDPRQIARKTGATLLFYWLGQKQSYLWAITPAKVALLPLPPQAEIVARADRYRKGLLEFKDPLQAGDEDGQALYKLLVAPASKLIRPDAAVMILADGELSKLNFETLLVQGSSPDTDLSSGQGPRLHYWIDDATLLSAPSLAMLAAAKPAQSSARSLLLLGDPVSPSEDFPSLPLFGFEMKSIQKYFESHDVVVFSSEQATPAAYVSSNPAKYSYIHFVSHAVASQTDPLDSAIILSASSTSPDSFKLYAREIMRHPIDARLVTISSCYGSGTRSYAGEGLVGLSWAFLRAGAHNVIGALWEVSDDSSPRLMDTLYHGLQSGQSPATALRNGKLSLLHSPGRFSAPFYWASFQVYTR